MTDPGQTPASPEPAADASTGVAVVDEAVGGLDGLEQRPVAERLPAFERAHETLRRALDDDPVGEPGGPGDRPGS